MKRDNKIELNEIYFTNRIPNNITIVLKLLTVGIFIIGAILVAIQFETLKNILNF